MQPSSVRVSPLLIHAQPTISSKKTSNLSFGQNLQQVAGHTSGFASRSLQQVSPHVPGGAVLSAALNEASHNIGGGAVGGMPGAGIMPTDGNPVQSLASLQQNMMSSNMYMLSLQHEFQQMSQQYMAVSNILKTKHDTEKNSITNIR